MGFENQLPVFILNKIITRILLSETSQLIKFLRNLSIVTIMLKILSVFSKVSE